MRLAPLRLLEAGGGPAWDSCYDPHVPPTPFHILFTFQPWIILIRAREANPEMSRGFQEKYPNLLTGGQPGSLRRPAGHTEAPPLTLPRSPGPFHPACVSGIFLLHLLVFCGAIQQIETWLPGAEGRWALATTRQAGGYTHSLSSSEDYSAFNIASKLCAVCMRGNLLTARKSDMFRNHLS